MTKLRLSYWLVVVAFFVAVPLAILVDCQQRPPVVGGAGGVVAMGGAFGQGGQLPTSNAAGVGGWLPIGNGGSLSTGGTVATGGASAVARCPVFTRMAVRRTIGTIGRPPMTGWHKDPHWSDLVREHAAKRAFASMVAREDSAYWPPNNRSPFNQLRVGKCTCEMAANCASTQPFALRLTDVDSDACYRAATRIDNGCAWDATACSGSWPPTDNGSYGTTALRAAVHLGWIKSYTAIPDVPTLIARMQRGPCGIGMTWRRDMFNPGPDGKLSVSGVVDGGHEAMTNVFCAVDSAGQALSPRRFYIDNSWGPWGVCLGSYCSYAYLEEPTLVAMVASGDAEIVCPDPFN